MARDDAIALTQRLPAVLLGATPAARGSTEDRRSATSPFVDSRWILRLNIGSEPGSFMPRRFPEWAASGARLGVPVELWFTDIPATDAVPDNVTKFFGADVPVFRVEVSPMTNSTFVSERGEEHVSFVGGGYSMERSMNNVAILDDDLGTPKPRFLLRFWIDCTSGAKRRDVELKPFTRIIGTIPVWDDPAQIARLDHKLAAIRTSIQAKQFSENDPTNPNSHNGDNSNTFLRKWSFLGGKKIDDEDETSLEYRQEQLERLLPLKGYPTAENGLITTAPKGSLVMPYTEENGDSPSVGVRKHKYFIVGSFSMKYSN